MWLIPLDLVTYEVCAKITVRPLTSYDPKYLLNTHEYILFSPIQALLCTCICIITVVKKIFTESRKLRERETLFCFLFLEWITIISAGVLKWWPTGHSAPINVSWPLSSCKTCSKARSVWPLGFMLLYMYVLYLITGHAMSK